MTSQNRPASRSRYATEMRFGVVMYGGVSLAIYINGVANELYELACATPRDGVPDGAEQPPDEDGCNTRCVYRWLSALLAEPGLLDRCREFLDADPQAEVAQFFALPATVETLKNAQRTRFVVDVVSGTSAGGINGLFLAKALANGEPFELLRDLWIDEGDIGKLLNDDGSRKDDKSLPPLDGLPRSLLNSDRMYQRLLKALRQMSERRQQGGRMAPTSDEIDLYVTTTDIRGSTLQLRLFDQLVPERRHRQVFRMRYNADPLAARNDFDDANLPFLAYVARCTSSFPFAFEPMNLKAVARGGGGAVSAADRQRWQGMVAGTGAGEDCARSLDRDYGDGGYLDNKPFSHAIEALTQREAEMPVERKLVYIEPSPQHPEDEDAALAGREAPAPDAVQNALAALLTIPRQETIREDLEAVLRRNRHIERVDRIVRLGERDLELGHADDPYLRELARDPKSIKEWNEMTLADLRRYYGDAFLPYRRLRVYITSDKLSERLAQLWGIDAGSDHLYALRALVRVWRDAHFPDERPVAAERADGRPPQTMNGFLNRFDLRFRTRRLRFLLRRIDALYRLLLKHDGSRLTAPASSLSELHALMLTRLRSAGLDLEQPLPAHLDVGRARDALLQLRQDFLQARDEVRAAELAVPRIGGEAGAARRHALGDLLRELLDLLLSNGGVDPASRLAGLMPAAVLDRLAKAVALPSATRTLQERVYARARLVFEGMAEHGRTELQNALEDDLEGLGQLVDDLVDGTEECYALAMVGCRLGRPAWEFAADGRGGHTAYVSVRDTGVAVLDTLEGKLLRRLLGSYYLRYDTFDQMSLPLHYGTDTGEPAPVEVVRISPEDATALIDERASGRKKLAGTTLGNFGGFLDEQWRRNDILWGRLDGAERLIHALLPAAHQRRVRASLIEAAQRAIARDLLAPPERAQLGGVVLKALQKLQRPTAAAPQLPPAEARVQALLQALALDDPARRKQIERVVGSLFDDRGLLRYLKTAYQVDRSLDPKRAMGHAARAVTVAGRVLEGVSEGREVQPLVRWMARIGLAAQGVAAAAVPGSLWALVTQHWLTVLYLIELVMVLLGLALTSPEVRNVGLTALALTAGVQAVITLVRDVMRQRPPLRSRVTWVLLAAAAGLAGVGAWSLKAVPFECLRPGVQCSAVSTALAAHGVPAPRRER